MGEDCNKEKLKMVENCNKEKLKMGEVCKKEKLKMDEDCKDETSTANQVGSFENEWKGLAGSGLWMNRKEPIFGKKTQNLA